MVSRDGGSAICARIQSPKQVGNKGAGWLHVIGQPIPIRPVDIAPRQTHAPPRNWVDFVANCCDALADGGHELAAALGVSVKSLLILRLGWSDEHGAYTFPMRDGGGNIIGVRTRYKSGAKRAVYGSRSGVFIPTEFEDDPELWICEGPTDCAALLSVGLNAIGRPSNTGGIEFIIEFVRRWRGTRVVVITDRDQRGTHAESLTALGARTLANEIARVGRLVRVIRPPVKDVREWIRSGAGRSALRCLAENVASFRPSA